MNAEKPRILSKEIVSLLNQKYHNKNQRIVCGSLITNTTTYRAALKGSVCDLLLFRMVNYKIDGFNDKPLIKLVNKHFSQGVNGLSI